MNWRDRKVFSVWYIDLLVSSSCDLLPNSASMRGNIVCNKHYTYCKVLFYSTLLPSNATIALDFIKLVLLFHDNWTRITWKIFMDSLDEHYNTNKNNKKNYFKKRTSIKENMLCPLSLWKRFSKRNVKSSYLKRNKIIKHITIRASSSQTPL